MGYSRGSTREPDFTAGGSALLAAETPGTWRTAAVPAGACALVADDDPAIRSLVADRLRACGWTVTEAPDGAAALALGTAVASGLRLVVCDVEMPGLDGLKVAAGLRAVHPAAAVVIMSGGWRPGTDPGRPAPPGAVFLPKPFGVAGLDAAVTEAIRGG